MAERGQESANHAVMRDTLGLEAGEPWCQMAMLCGSKDMRPCVAWTRHGRLSGGRLAVTTFNPHTVFAGGAFAVYRKQGLEGKSCERGFERQSTVACQYAPGRLCEKVSGRFSDLVRGWRTTPFGQTKKRFLLTTYDSSRRMRESCFFSSKPPRVGFG